MVIIGVQWGLSGKTTLCPVRPDKRDQRADVTVEAYVAQLLVGNSGFYAYTDNCPFVQFASG